MTTENDASAEQQKKKTGKVELDLDDAPFLEEELEEEKSKAAEPEEKTEEKTEEAKPEPAGGKTGLLDKLKERKKLVMLAGAGLLVVIAAAVGVALMLGGRTQDAPPPPPQEEKAPPPKPPVVVVVDNAPKEAPAQAPLYTINWEPFLVEVKDNEGGIHLLDVKFTFTTDDNPVYVEMDNKTRIMRDSVFYFMRNRSYDLLIDSSKLQDFKDGVAKVLNDNINNGELKTVLIDHYRVR